jgi:hypothetical protein
MSIRETTIESTVWIDEMGKYVRFSIPEFGVSVQLELLHSDEPEKQSAIAVAALKESALIISSILDMANKDD